LRRTADEDAPCHPSKLSMTVSAILLLTFLLIVAIVSLRQHQHIIRDLRRSRDRLRTEEHRAFDFLHGLGRALEESDTQGNMHRYIVEGLVRAMDVDGGALYLLESSSEELVPAFVSGDCPALTELPGELSEGTQPDQAELTNFQRLHCLPASHPVYGEALEGKRRLIISNLAEEPGFRDLASPAHEDVAVLVEPLVYAGRVLGLLMVANRRKGETYNENQKDVFHSLAEQSAFALGSAMLHREARDKRLLDTELRTASEFQRILMPAKAPNLSLFDIAGVNYPAKVVSGDYYDYLEVDEDHLGIVIADVSGKGVPASLIMANCRSILRAKAAGESSPAKVLKAVNRQIFPDIREDMFITMTYLILDGASDRIRIARGGHSAPLLCRGDSGDVEKVEAVGTAVGIDSGGVFDRIIEDQEFELRSGDALLLTTDGVTEALNDQGEEFGNERLIRALKDARHHTAAGMLARICEDVRRFAGAAEQSDDITLIGIKKGSMV